MNSLAYYMTEYSKSHQSPRNIAIHNVCVPLIAWSVLAFAHTFTLLGEWRVSHLIAVAALLFYSLFKNPRVLAVMALFIAAIFLTLEFIPYLRIVAIVIFVAAWIGQFYGHKIEGKKPSFLQDLLFLLIGPLWVMKKAFPRFLEIND